MDVELIAELLRGVALGQTPQVLLLERSLYGGPSAMSKPICLEYNVFLLLHRKAIMCINVQCVYTGEWGCTTTCPMIYPTLYPSAMIGLSHEKVMVDHHEARASGLMFAWETSDASSTYTFPSTPEPPPLVELTERPLEEEETDSYT